MHKIYVRNSEWPIEHTINFIFSLVFNIIIGRCTEMSKQRKNNEFIFQFMLRSLLLLFCNFFEVENIFIRKL